MDPLQLLVTLALTGICGAFAELIVGFDPRGLSVLLLSIVVGLVGSALGVAIADLLVPSPFMVRVGNQRIDMFWGTVGSIVVLLLLWLVQRGGRAIFSHSA